MDSLNRFHTKMTYWIVRAENIALLLVLSGLLIWRAGEVHWWRAVAAFWIIDIVGYIPGAIAYRYSEGRADRPLVLQQLQHRPHLPGDRDRGRPLGLRHRRLRVGHAGGADPPVRRSRRLRQHPEAGRAVVRAATTIPTRSCCGRSASATRRVREEDDRGRDRDVGVEELVSREVLTEVMEHPSGYLALSRRNRVFVADGIPGFISYRKQGKHLWLFGGVHARPEHAGELLDRFLDFAAAKRQRVAAVQVRQSQVDLFASRGFTVNQLGTTFAVSLKDFSLGGGPKMQLRNKIQKARRLGLKVVELGKDVPRDATWFAKLEEISARWLEGKGKKELDFMVGEIGGPDDHDRRIFLVLDADEQPDRVHLLRARSGATSDPDICTT